MKITEETIEGVVSALREELPEELQYLFREIHKEFGTIIIVLPPKHKLNPSYQFHKENPEVVTTLAPYSTHFGVGMSIRNWLGKYGVDRVADDGSYYLDDIWAPLTEMAIGVRETSARNM